ncbi:MAG: sigma-70 family RNA polymerase sigma factor [Nannocystaceae bacterium]|nr:sigma-70 family RNA polymerase sigma factor [Nannocystaceae bacterium]
MLDDHALLAHWRDGDRSAGDALFERHFKSVRRFFKSKVGPTHAEDLIQRTFLGCIQSMPLYRGDASFRTYLFAVARNVLYMHFRQLHRGPGLEPDASVRSVVDLKTGVSTALGRQDERRLIQVALRHLPIEAQTLLELAYWEGLTALELAKVFDVSPITIRTRKHRARAKLREIVDALRDPNSALVHDLDAATADAREN